MTAKPQNNTAEMDVVQVSVADLDTSGNRELDEGHVERLMESIRQHGLFSPVRATRDNCIVDGGHRFEACRRLGFESVPVVYHDGAVMPARIQSNTVRKDLTFTQRIEAAKWVEENCVRPRGRPRKDSPKTTELDKDGAVDVNISQNFGRLLCPAEDIVVAYQIYTNQETYRQAKHINENCVPRVIELIDAGVISYNFAYKEIAQKIPMDKQLSALHKIEELAAASIDPKGAKRAVRAALKDKRIRKAGIDPADTDTGPIDGQLYNVIYASPDFQKSTVETLAKFPIRRHGYGDTLVFIQAPTTLIDNAYALCRAWGLVYRYTLRVEPVGGATIHGFVFSEMPIDIVACDYPDSKSKLWRDLKVQSTHYGKIPRHEGRAIITKAYGPNAQTRMLDLSLREALDGWHSCWADYGYGLF